MSKNQLKLKMQEQWAYLKLLADVVCHQHDKAVEYKDYKSCESLDSLGLEIRTKQELIDGDYVAQGFATKSQIYDIKTNKFLANGKALDPELNVRKALDEFKYTSPKEKQR